MFHSVSLILKSSFNSNPVCLLRRLQRNGYRSFNCISNKSQNETKPVMRCFTTIKNNLLPVSFTKLYFSTVSKEDLTPKEKFKKAAKEYGFVLVAFHVGISLMSLGSIYFFIINGFDVQQWISFIGMSNADENTKIVAGASQFIIAYAIHKSLAPFRISITLVSVPLIVRYLRTKGFMKKKN